MGNSKKIKVKQISKEILIYLLTAGAICIAASSPRFISNLAKIIFKYKLYQKRKFLDSFNYLKRKELVEIEKREDGNVQVTLTEKGRNRAKKYEIEDLDIGRPKKWDKRWRVVIFDIPHEQRVVRNIVQRKLKELGFYPLQKSVWLHPFECQEEIKIIKNFFGLKSKEMQVILAERIENALSLKNFFKL